MSETLYMRISTQNSVFTVPNAHITLIHILSIQPANKAVEYLINSYEYSTGKENRSDAYFIKNSIPLFFFIKAYRTILSIHVLVQ